MSTSEASTRTSPKQAKKKVWLELLRIFAVFLVIFNHTGDYGFHYFATIGPGYRYWLFMACSALTVMNIPIFYMISGALLLGRDEPIGVVWKKRVARYALVIVLFTFVQYLYLCFTGDDGFRETFRVSDWLVTMLTKNIIVPYWFLYEYLGFLVMLPLLRRLVQNLRDREFLYLFGLYLVFTMALPAVEYVATHWHTLLNPSFDISAVTSNLLVYPALGYFLTRKPKPTGKQLGLLWAMSLLCVIYCCLMTEYKIGYAHQLSEARVGTFFQMFIPIPAATVFLTFRKLFDVEEGAPASATPAAPGAGLAVPEAAEPASRGFRGFTLTPGVEKLTLSMGSCVFGIYLLEQIGRELLFPVGQLLTDHLPNFLATFLYCILVLFATYLPVLVLKQIPGLKKLI